MSTDVDALVSKASFYATREQVEAAGFVPGWHGEPIAVGDDAVIHGRGQFRLVTVTKVTATKVHGEYTTPGAIEQAQRIIERILRRDPLRERARTYEQELKNWDFMERELGPNSKYGMFGDAQRERQYRAAVDEGREQYAQRKADEVAEGVRADAAKVREQGWAAYVTVTKASGDRTGKQASNLYVRPVK